MVTTLTVRSTLRWHNAGAARSVLDVNDDGARTARRRILESGTPISDAPLAALTLHLLRQADPDGLDQHQPPW